MQLRAIRHVHRTHLQHQVTGTQSGALGGTACHHLAEDRPPPWPLNANLAQQLGIGVACLQPRCLQHNLALHGARTRLHGQAHVVAFQRRTRQRPAQILEGTHGLNVLRPNTNPQNQFPATQACLLGDGTRGWAGKVCLWLLDAAPIDHGVQQHRQQQVRQRPGRNNRSAGTQRLVIESQVALALIHRRLALVEHAHIAAQRKRSNDELGGRTLPPPAQQRHAKADGKAQHLDTAGNRHAVMAVLMHSDQNGQRHEESNHGQQHGSYLLTQPYVPRRLARHYGPRRQAPAGHAGWPCALV